MPPELKPGDLVKLRSGSPVMTVSRTNAEDELARVVWYEGGGYRFETFPFSSLEKVPPTVP